MIVRDILKEVEFFVEATPYEESCIRKEYKGKCKWEQLNPGFTQIIGYIGKKKKNRPIHVSFFFDKINGRLFCFYNTISRFNDSTMVKKWLKKNYPVTYDNGIKFAITDAQNFHHAFEYLTR